MNFSYDFHRRRWYDKPLGSKWSDYVIGPMANHRELLENGRVTVSVYRTRDGVIRYTQPVSSPAKEAGPGVLYRVRVRLKNRQLPSLNRMRSDLTDHHAKMAAKQVIWSRHLAEQTVRGYSHEQLVKEWRHYIANKESEE